MGERFRIAGKAPWKGRSDTRHQQWHVSGWPAVALTPLFLPVALILLLTDFVLGRKQGANLTAAGVRGYISDFLEGRDGEWDWDDFTSIALSDPELEKVRQEAEMVPLPLTEEGRAKLQSLLDRLDDR